MLPPPFSVYGETRDRSFWINPQTANEVTRDTDVLVADAPGGKDPNTMLTSHPRESKLTRGIRLRTISLRCTEQLERLHGPVALLVRGT